MYLSKTPLRVSLFGGGTDFPEFFNKEESFILGGTINKYVYTTINNQLLDTNSKSIKLFYRKTERVKYTEDIQHKVIKELFLSHNIKKNIELHIASDLPTYSGLGSSSSFSAGLINLINYFFGKKLTKNKLALKTIDLERNKLSETVGYQDQIHASYGGFNLIRINKNGFYVKNLLSKKIKALEKNLVLVFTGITRKANNIEKKKIKRINLNLEHLKKINKISKNAYKILVSKKMNDLSMIGKLMHDTWQLKKELLYSVSNKKIDKIYNTAIKNGALGGKLLGAGSGGFILFYVPKKNKQKFKNLMSKYNLIDLKFTNKGSEVIEL